MPAAAIEQSWIVAEAAGLAALAASVAGLAGVMELAAAALAAIKRVRKMCFMVWPYSEILDVLRDMARDGS